MIDVEVAIIGGGLAGISTAYHLAERGIETIVLEAGKLGKGSDNMISGTLGPNMPEHSKMINFCFEDSYDEFSESHSTEEAKKYLKFINHGCKTQKTLARKINPSLIRKLGGISVGTKENWEIVKAELEHYKRLGFGKGFKILSSKEINEIFGFKDGIYKGGLFRPQEAIIDSQRYLIGLAKNPLINLVEKTNVISIEDKKDKVIIRTQNRGNLTASQAVIATNGFIEDENLKGLIKMYWSFIVSYEDKGPNTPNANEEIDNYHYWTRQDNILMIGGELISVEKGNTRFPEDEHERIRKLDQWVKSVFPRIKSNPIATHYGIETETIDRLPIVGKFSEEDRVSYIVGCNGIGQSIFSYAATLMPCVLGYSSFNPEQKELSDFVSPKRKTLYI